MVNVLYTYGFSVKKHARLKTFLKKFDVDHIKKKSGILTFGKIKEDLNALFNKNNNMYLTCIAGKYH